MTARTSRKGSVLMADHRYIPAISRRRPLSKPATRSTAIARVALASLGLITAPAMVFAGPATASTTGHATLATARKALFVLSDFPTSWTSSKSTNSKSPMPGAAQIASCIGVPRSVIVGHAPNVISPEFDAPNHLLIAGDTVTIYPSAQAATTEYSSLANPKTPGCLSRVMNGSARAEVLRSLGTTNLVGPIRVTRAPSRYFAPGGANFTMTLSLKEKGVQLNVRFTVVDYVKGNEEQTVDLMSIETGFPTALAMQLTQDAKRRLQ